MTAILIIVLLLAVVGVFPIWPHSRGWGYYRERRDRHRRGDHHPPAADARHLSGCRTAHQPPGQRGEHNQDEQAEQDQIRPVAEMIDVGGFLFAIVFIGIAHADLPAAAAALIY